MVHGLITLALALVPALVNWKRGWRFFIVAGVLAVVVGVALLMTRLGLSPALGTFIAGVVLYNVGVGPVRGFAVTLMIGILTSMFTAIVGTRAVVNLLYGNKEIKKLPI